jgi:hypothetical protein
MNGKNKRRLTIEDRKKLERLLHSGSSKKQISQNLNIHPSTIFREIQRCQESYDAEEAQKTYGKSKNRIDFKIIGKKFGLLTVKSFANIYKKRSWWHCICDCGKECIISRKMLYERCSKKRLLSCGCVPKQWSGSKNKQLPLEELALRKYHDLLRFRRISGDCWEWLGYKYRGKTPKCSWRSISMGVRKCMYLLCNGLTHEPNPVYTTCDNLLCFNPDHITLQHPKKRIFYE